MSTQAVETHEYIIVGDENDGDYHERKIKYNPFFAKIIIENGRIFPGNSAVELDNLIDSLIRVISLPHPNGWHYTHNWSRPEYDKSTDAHRTCRLLILDLFGLDLDSESFPHDPDEVLENMMEVMHDRIIPYNDIGIHTITAIKSRPIPIETPVYSQPNYHDRAAIFENQMRHTHIVRSTEGLLLINGNSKPIKAFGSFCGWHHLRFETVDDLLANKEYVLVENF